MTATLVHDAAVASTRVDAAKSSRLSYAELCAPLTVTSGPVPFRHDSVGVPPPPLPEFELVLEP